MIACSGAVIDDTKSIGYLATNAPVNHYNMAVEGAKGASGEWTANHGTKVLKSDGTAPSTLQPYLVLNYIIKY